MTKVNFVGGFRRALLLSTAAVGGLVMNGAALAQNSEADEAKVYSIPPSDVGNALQAYSEQADVEIIYAERDVEGKTTDGVDGSYSREAALEEIISDADLSYEVNDDGVVVIRSSFLDLKRAPSRATEVRMARASVSVSSQDLEAVSAETEIIYDEDEEAADVIIVTGTNIPGFENLTSPVFVFDREDIRLSGATTAQDFVRTLPQNLDLSESSAGGLVGPDNGPGGVGAGINIRGLGGSATLTLVNGRRLAAGAGTGEFVDISLIPLSAIERIEVLTDGASAIYGADAVAGVVNFILRDDYDGAESQVRLGTATTGRGSPKTFQASQTIGESWSTGNVMVSYDYYRRNNLDANDRPFSEGADDPTDLLPNHQRHSVLINARQEVSEQLELFGTASFASQDASFSQTGGVIGASRFQIGDDKQYGANISGQYNFANDWRVNLSGGYSRNEADLTLFQAGAFDRDVATAFNIWTADLIADGVLFQGPGGAVRIAFGGQYRKERFESVVETSSSMDVLDLQRDVYAAFAELALPIVGENNRRPGVYALDVTAAARFEDFSDAGSSTNPKVGIRYAPIEELSFRGTYSTAFQAPRFRDLGAPQIFSALPGFFFPSAPGSTTPNPDVIIATGGNPDLQPETSRNYTIGVDYSPQFAGGAKLSLTYFDIDFSDRVGTPGPSLFSIFTTPEAFGTSLTFNPDSSAVASIFADPTFFNFFAVMPSDIGVILDERLQNLASTEVRGLDIGLSYNTETSIGAFSFDLNGSYLFDFIDQASAVSEPVQTLNTVGNPVDLRFRSSVGWSNDGFSANLFVNYVDSYTNTETGIEAPVDSWTTIDLNLGYDTSDQGVTSLLDNTRFNLSIRNLFNEEPPFADQNLGTGVDFDGTNANALGRIISFSISKAW